MKARKLHKQEGFTIVELMIATSVLAVILLLATVIMTNIGRLYTKGINQARVQGTVRSVSDEITQQLQYGGDVRTSASGDTKAFCIGSTRYNYVEGVRIGESKNGVGPYRHVLWRDTVGSGSCPAPAVLTGSLSSGTELISPNSRLTNLSIAGTAVGSGIQSPYTLTVGVAYGEGDLLDDQNSLNPTCKGGLGGQFCSTARLVTQVVQRTD